jgi:RNA polymerase sigma-70 factor (ECF subfamily)
VSTPASDETELVRRAASGDDEAFRILVDRLWPTLRRWALARTGDPDAADDVVQRALISMHRGLAGFRGDARLSTWLYRLVARAATDSRRWREAGPERVPMEAPEREAAGGAEGTDPVRSIHAQRLAAVVRDYLEALPPRQREVLALVDHDGVRPVEAAEMLDMKPVTVRANLFKARRAVRERMLARYPELMEGYET